MYAGWLPTIPTDGLVAVFAPNDDEALVTRTAFADAGRAEQLRIASHGADEGARTAIACDPAWVAEAAFWPERFGRIAVPALLDVLAGKAVPADLRIPHVALTAATIRESYPDIAAC